MLKARKWIHAGLTTLALGCAADPANDEPQLVEPGSPGAEVNVAADGPEQLDRAQLAVLSDIGNEAALAGEDPLPEPALEEEPELAAEPTAGCLDGITNYKTTGRFRYRTETAGAVKMWVPSVPAGCKVPVVHLANGTGARCSTYGGILTHLASHGFLAVCYENTNTGQGTQCITALETAMARHPELVDDKIGSTGHSQGGGAAFMCLQRAEARWGSSKIYAGLAMEPASGFGDSPANWASYYAQIKSPMFMFNGSADFLVSASWVGRAFDALANDTEAYWYEATGAAHIPIPTRWTQESAVAWFRWKLLGDNAACRYFKSMPAGRDWNPRRNQAETSCE